jgi:hypothetical protein
MDIEALASAVYEDLEPRLVCAHLVGKSDLLLELECADWSGGNLRRKFDVRCGQVKASEVSVGEAGAIEFLSDHPVLLEHKGAQGALYFSSAPASPDAVFFVAIDLLTQRFEGWRDPLNFLNGEPREVRNHLTGGNGLLARGPLTVMEELRNQLRPLLAVRVLQEQVEEEHWKALIVGSNWVVCDTVSVVERAADRVARPSSEL